MLPWLHIVGGIMQRYTESLALLNDALNLMLDEGDTLLIASLAHPICQMEERLTQCRAKEIEAHI
jgi:inactivated superfamily I helicase